MECGVCFVLGDANGVWYMFCTWRYEWSVVYVLYF